MRFKVWAFGVFFTDSNTKIVTGFWDSQELAEYALGQILEDTEYNFLLDAFVAEAINNSVNIFVSEIQNNDGSKIYTTLVDCWLIYIRNFGLTSQADCLTHLSKR